MAVLPCQFPVDTQLNVDGDGDGDAMMMEM